MTIKASKKEKNILYELHESDFVGYAIKGEDLILRVGINCAVAANLDIDCEFGEKYYIYDIVCHKYKDFVISYDNDSKQDIVLSEILAFQVHDDKYVLTLEIEACTCAYFVFDCESIEWKPVKLITWEELDSIETTDYINIK